MPVKFLVENIFRKMVLVERLQYGLVLCQYIEWETELEMTEIKQEINRFITDIKCRNDTQSKEFRTSNMTLNFPELANLKRIK